MNKTERIYSLDRLLRAARQPVAIDRICGELECSRATAKRLLAELRDRLNAPLEYDRERRGYHYRPDQARQFELPGLWLTESELFALLAAEQLLAQAEPGVLADQLAPLRARIQRTLHASQASGAALSERVLLRAHARRALPGKVFETVADATLRTRRIRCRYHARHDDREQERELSPWRLEYYRDNWYLLAWCHLRRAWRRFALDRIRQPRIGAEPAAWEAAPPSERGYGLFNAGPLRWACLRFTPRRARWVADERWHPEQHGEYLADGSYQLRIPYSDDTELLADVLRFGADVVVLDPPELRARVAEQLRRSLAAYETTAPRRRSRSARSPAP